MNEMVERVGLLLTRAKVGWSDAAVPVDAARQLARQVIAAMREPTEPMKDAGRDEYNFGDVPSDTREAVAAIWRDMIDEAMREP